MLREMYLWVIELLFIPADAERLHNKLAVFSLAVTLKYLQRSVQGVLIPEQLIVVTDTI